jgi:hypothetical protein
MEKFLSITIATIYSFKFLLLLLPNSNTAVNEVSFWKFFEKEFIELKYQGDLKNRGQF